MGSLAELVALIIIMCTSVTMSLAQNPMASPKIENPNTTVVIYNDLEGSWPMSYHCVSRDVDFGIRRMPSGGSWSFEFRPSVSGDTKFICSFAWRLAYRYFRIYIQERDQESAVFGCKRCEWKIREDGPCKLNKKTGMFDLCPPWDSQLSENN
ncbi:unnamed protein product [Arabidopsis lyrata]|uniref:S-protein homolog 2 n=1 Tax=Arabidopsis lyrata subsp. lyrata TaxID=81972 RepID=UPI000A29DF6C|nr:S-protein homolog 2 [Arabidopsis lyrata subsp. lyrata]CAH8260777.1 unnamed protein product [Arabidopsis lyrata]|eukprot:XP_020889234.1 S-protein homolog 2 [Arabidopsis lyrata subsp. lyrata]